MNDNRLVGDEHAMQIGHRRIERKEVIELERRRLAFERQRIVARAAPPNSDRRKKRPPSNRSFRRSSSRAAEHVRADRLALIGGAAPLGYRQRGRATAAAADRSIRAARQRARPARVVGNPRDDHACRKPHPSAGAAADGAGIPAEMTMICLHAPSRREMLLASGTLFCAARVLFSPPARRGSRTPRVRPRRSEEGPPRPRARLAVAPNRQASHRADRLRWRQSARAEVRNRIDARRAPPARSDQEL